MPSDPQARAVLVHTLAETLSRREDAELRGFFSYVLGTYSPELALDVAVAALLAARIAPPSE